MKKLLTLMLAVSLSAFAYAQKTPPKPGSRPKLPPPPHERGDLPAPPEAPPAPPSPKELFQKLKAGKKKMDAKREQDLKEMERNAPR